MADIQTDQQQQTQVLNIEHDSTQMPGTYFANSTNLTEPCQINDISDTASCYLESESDQDTEIEEDFISGQLLNSELIPNDQLEQANQLAPIEQANALSMPSVPTIILLPAQIPTLMCATTSLEPKQISLPLPSSTKPKKQLTPRQKEEKKENARFQRARETQEKRELRLNKCRVYRESKRKGKILSLFSM